MYTLQIYHLQNDILKPVTENLEANDPWRRLRHGYQLKKAKPITATRYKATNASGEQEDKKKEKAKFTLDLYKNTHF